MPNITYHQAEYAAAPVAVFSDGQFKGWLTRTDKYGARPSSLFDSDCHLSKWLGEEIKGADLNEARAWIEDAVLAKQ